MEKIVLIGGGGHCKVIIDIIKGNNCFEIIGITDYKITNDTILDIPVIGNDDLLFELYNKGITNAFICIGAMNNQKFRLNLFNKLKKIGYNVPILIHKNAIVSSYTKIGEGTCIMAGAIINPGVEIMDNCIINTGAIIEHDCIIGTNTHISPNVSLGGGVQIGQNSHIGIGSTIIHKILIGSNVIVGAGAVVIENISSNITAVGVPAKNIKER